MAKLRVQVPHELDKVEAIDRLRIYSTQLRGDFAGQVSHVEETWSEDGVVTFSFRMMGFRVSGITTTSEVDVMVAVDLPFAALPIRGLIEKEIVSRIQNALGS
jgi:hypothetical protein